jgi:hypothetical protein
MQIDFIFPLILTGIALYYLFRKGLLEGIQLLRQLKSMKENGNVVKGEIIDIEISKDNDGYETKLPVVQYFVNDKCYTIRGKVPKQNASIGQWIDVWYVPENPSEVVLDFLNTRSVAINTVIGMSFFIIIVIVIGIKVLNI